MKRTFFASQKISANELNGDLPFSLEYYLLTNQVFKSNDLPYERCYGVEIIKKFTDVSNNEVTQKNSVTSMTYDKKEIYDFLRSIYNGKVTPMSLCEIADDYMSYIEQTDVKQA